MSRLTRLGALAVLAFVLAGCGNSNDTSSVETSTTSTPAPTVALITTVPPTTTTAGASAATGTQGCVDRSDVVKGTTSGELQSGGLDRTYLVHVPTSYDGSTAMPLVLEFHSYSTSASGHSAYSGLGQLGEEEGFITAMPDRRGDPRRWLFEPDEAAIDITTENPGRGTRR